jgi:hypothetical protein
VGYGIREWRGGGREGRFGLVGGVGGDAKIETNVAGCIIP